jgi:SAM-dependent methyltransferase
MDVVFSKSFIEHFYIGELPHIFSEVSRVLKPGGVCVFLTPDWEYNSKEFYQVFTHVTPYTRSSIEQCLKMYGFDQVWSKSLIQLPQVWERKFLTLLSDITSYLPIPRSAGKWVRWSKERYLLGVGYKPKV